MKASIIQKGNQATFKMHPEIVTKRMNKEDRHSHLLLIKLWVLHFSPWCGHTAQGMLIKLGKYPCVIFYALTKGHPHKVVSNDVTTTKFEAYITFGVAKLKMLQQFTIGESVIQKARYILLLRTLQHVSIFQEFMLFLRELLDLWLSSCTFWQ
jgi:hypothetical protein